MVKLNKVCSGEVKLLDIRCQQFTAQHIANEMLDMLGYCHDLYGRTLLENSCGEGNILCLAVERYIQDAISNGYGVNDIVFGLERDIFGAEIIEVTAKKCIENLNMISHKYGIENVQWNIFIGDVLTRPFDFKFNFIIGNPPYISYRNLEKKARAYIKAEYSTCTEGKPDYCYAFVENAVDYLAPNGRMVYLIPNSIFKNVFAEKLREYIKPYIVEIKDFPNCKLFENATTSSAIMLLKKGVNAPQFRYINVSQNEQLLLERISLNGKWVFSTRDEYDQTVYFRDYFKASMAIATQRNKVFVINKKAKAEFEIERGVLRPAVSPRNQKYGNKEFIIFPYMIRNHVVVNYLEKDFKEKYPRTYLYLEEKSKELKERDADKSAQWFEYGRSQAIQNMNKEKLLVSTVVTNRIDVYKVSNRAIPYAGIFITSDKGYDLRIAKLILESEAFLNYVRKVGTPASGSSLRITAKDISNFRFVRDNFFDEQQVTGW